MQTVRGRGSTNPLRPGTSLRRVHQALRSTVVPVGLSLAVLAGSVPALAAPAPAERAPAAPSAAAGVPETMASSVAASARVVDPSFPVDYVAVTWTGSHGHAAVRFRHGTTWTAWQDMAEDGIEETGTFASSLVPADDADAYQVQIPGGVQQAKSVAINTTDGAPQTTTAGTAATATGEKTTWGVVTRAGWGADESLRFDGYGNEDWPQSFSTPQKFTVHHTAGINDDPNPAATVRAIYRFHAIDRGWGDIGYQFLIDAQGTVYEGRQTDTSLATPPAFDATGKSVQGAHVADHNSGNIGISLLGTYVSRRPSALTQRSLERLLASLSVKTGIDPTGWGWYDNGDPDLTVLRPEHHRPQALADRPDQLPGRHHLRAAADHPGARGGPHRRHDRRGQHHGAAAVHLGRDGYRQRQGGLVDAERPVGHPAALLAERLPLARGLDAAGHHVRPEARGVTDRAGPGRLPVPDHRRGQGRQPAGLRDPELPRQLTRRYRAAPEEAR